MTPPGHRHRSEKPSSQALGPRQAAASAFCLELIVHRARVPLLDRASALRPRPERSFTTAMMDL
jgi:hypothetical protein